MDAEKTLSRALSRAGGVFSVFGFGTEEGYTENMR